MRAGQEGGARRGAFFLGVNEVVSKVSRGRVASYGQLAAPAGMPHAARTVGWALHCLPAQSGVPWHRVADAQGGIRLNRAYGTAALQRALLAEEGVVFDSMG